ncbi:MAG: hypothetical protein KDC87_11305, partial [Planctomycetes bacterium]|nr:hypothetical protein [Planctomycetota bacterium]
MSHFVRFTGMAMLVSLVACVSPERHRQVLSANRALQEERDDMKRFVAQAQQENARLAQELERIRPRIKDAAELERQKKEVEAILTGLKRGGGGSLPPGVKTLSTTEGLMLRVEGRVLFSSGSTKLSQSGQDTLKRLVDTIRDHTGQVRVAGHTDDDPI